MLLIAEQFSNFTRVGDGDIYICHIYIYIYDLVPKGVHENRTKGVENKVDDTLKLVVFLDWAQC